MGTGEGLGTGITGEAATGGGAVTGAGPGQALPVLPPQTLLDDAIATRISAGRCSATASGTARVRPSRTVHVAASICLFSMSFSIILFSVAVPIEPEIVFWR